MRRGKDLIGMPVVVTDSRIEIERVEGLVLDYSETHVSALLVDSDDWSRQARVLPLHDVQSFGRKEIAVSSSNAIHDVAQIPEIRRVLNRDLPLTGTRIVTGDGSEIGTVNDILFDEDTGGIDTFQFYSGARTNRYFERFALPLYDELDDEVIVHISEVKQQPNQGPAFKCEASIKNRTEGATGTRMREEEGAATDAVKWPFTTVFDRIRRGMALFQRSFKNLREKAQCEMVALRKKAFEVKDKHDIQRAMGRRVKVTILGTEDEIVVNQGEFITPAVIDRAREAGVLRDLFRAVDRTATDIETKRACRWMDEWWPPYI